MSDASSDIETSSSLELEDRGGYFSRSFAIPAHDLGEICEVKVAFREAATTCYAEWRTEEPPEIGKLQFDHASYSIKDGEQRFVRLLAPWDLVVSTDPRPSVSLIGDSSISQVRSEHLFGYQVDGGYGACSIPIRGRGVGARARIIARLGESLAEADIAVTSRGVSGVRIDFEELRVEQRAIMAEDGSSLKINASHPSVSRYLGPKAKKWPGQNAIYFRTMLAEIITWAFSRYVVQNRRQQEKLDSYRTFYEQMQLMDKWLPRVHSVLVTKEEILAASLSE